MYRMTASLLNAWYWLFRTGDKEGFLSTLHRRPFQPTKKMDKGNDFEAWAYENIPCLKDTVKQVALYKTLQIGDDVYNLSGRLDALRAGIIYDVKYTSGYNVGQYFGGIQTDMYFELLPGAFKFVYIIGNQTKSGIDIYSEEYARATARPIAETILQFRQWLVKSGYDEVYKNHWGVDNVFS